MCPGSVDERLVGAEFMAALELQKTTLAQFHDIAGRVCGQSCPLKPPAANAMSLERNFFSSLFLAVTRAMVGDSPYLPLYAMVNQGMRAWVTACDNILDDEYKEIFAFDLPAGGQRMRSVLTLMLADRVLAEYVADHYPRRAVLREVGRVSLAALMSSATQECEEEQRPVTIRPPRDILTDIHVRKTGDLFAAPLALPLRLERPDERLARAARQALTQFGLACQVLDDIRDMPADIASGRHNLLVSLLAFGRGEGRISAGAYLPGDRGDWMAWERFPAVCAEAEALASRRFKASFSAMSELGLPVGPLQRRMVVEWMYTLLKVTPSGRGIKRVAS